MRQLVLLIWLLLINLVVAAKTEYFPGMVHLVTGTYISSGPTDDLSKQESNTIVFRFCTQPNDTTEIHTLSYYFDWSHIPRKEKIAEDDYRTWLLPMSFDDDTNGFYDIYLTCKSRRGDWLEVIVNEKTKETLWIKNVRFVRFLSWDKLGRGNCRVSVSAKTKVYNQRDTTSAPLTPASNCFEIDKIKGNWMQVSNGESELCDSYDKPVLKKVWIRFRSPEELLIDVTAY